MKVTAHSNDTFLSVSGPKRTSNELRSCVCLSVCLILQWDFLCVSYFTLISPLTMLFHLFLLVIN